MPEPVVNGTGPIDQKLPTNSAAQTQRFRECDLAQRVFIVTGGGRGLGLVSNTFSMACFIRSPLPAAHITQAILVWEKPR